jgi:hypothetical protein|tara:strand:- start:6275 stop:6616 length:342 start_codon:yes stop_codon:yes gene_type:complete
MEDKRVIKLTESDLENIVRRVINEQDKIMLAYLENAKYRLNNVLKYLDIEYISTSKGKFVKIHYIPVGLPQSNNPEWVSVRYTTDEDLRKIGEELKLRLLPKHGKTLPVHYHV